MLNQPMSSPMMKTMFGGLPDARGDVGCCACAEVVTPAPDSADAATNDEPLNKRSRRLRPSLFGVTLPSDFLFPLVRTHDALSFC